MRTSMILASALTFLGLGAVLVPGCGVSPEAACQNFDASLCAELEKCSSFGVEITYGDATRCESRLKDKCLESLEIAGSKATADDIESCANAYSELSCADAFTGVQPKECDVRGEKSDGASCATGVQCKSGKCQSTKEGECGTCVTPVIEGGSCATTNGVCTQGTYCGASGKCQSYGQTGATCDDKNRCVSNLWCKAGSCAEKLATEGAACTDTNECDINAGFVCSPLTNKCITIGVAKLGAACGVDLTAGTYTLCEADSFCDADQTGAGTCKAKIAVGNSCTISDSTGASDCVTGAQCIGGKCSTSYPTCN